ncbi:unnamed protein product [Coffea canephora]|uniref:DH200=94 genomic scaffold, scaffold_867 n=1 Tax=Coffea canephora TaxID=49390 RepID=A0A068VHH9_COFCA|nr:unnamed protein product [Coffea canephora]
MVARSSVAIYLITSLKFFFVCKELASIFVHLSLKEGFTVFRDPIYIFSEFSSDVGSSTVKRIADVLKLRIYQYPQDYKADAGPLAHPVRPHSYIKMDNFFTGKLLCMRRYLSLSLSLSRSVMLVPWLTLFDLTFITRS